MNRREVPHNDPPTREPYFRVRIHEDTLVLRALSIHAVSKLIRDHIPGTTIGRFAVLMDMVSAGDGKMLIAALQTAPEVCEMCAALIGLCWADPVIALDTPAPALGIAGGRGARSESEGQSQGEALSAFGSLVYEELHEAGWGLGHIAAATMAIVDKITEQSQVESSIMARASFFLQPRAQATPSGSPSSASISDPTEGDDSTS